MSKPFDLQKALAGHPCETVDGKKVIRIAHFPESPILGTRLQVLIEGNSSPYSYYENGILGFGSVAWRLVLSSTKKTGWVNLYSYGSDLMPGLIFVDKDKALKDKDEHGQHPYVATASIEWEE